MTITKPIDQPEKSLEEPLNNVSPLIIGGAVFNTQYAKDPSKLPVKSIIETAFTYGINTIDTSPYYGPSEELIGGALEEIKQKYPRESYYICTKAGRIRLDEFDYSREWVRKSVLRSLERLKTTYLDLVYLHDVEFVDEQDIYEGLKELNLLKKEGLVKNIGITGYPVEFLYQIASKCPKISEIGPLDGILSYSNGCIQNTLLFDYQEDFASKCNLKKLMNGSILSMSLLRSQKTHDFHPASSELKQKVQEIASYLKKEHNGLELADLATRFALRKWLFETPPHDNDITNSIWNQNHSIVLGVSSVEELEVAIKCYWEVKLNTNSINSTDVALFEEVKKQLGEQFYNMTWPSGKH